jgi:hypothetical protein
MEKTRVAKTTKLEDDSTTASVVLLCAVALMFSLYRYYLDPWQPFLRRRPRVVWSGGLSASLSSSARPRCH